MALCAQGVGSAIRSSGCTRIRTLEQIGDELSRQGSLAELVSALQDMRERGAVRAIGSVAAEFPIVVAVMAVRAQDADAHVASPCAAIEV